MKKLRVLPPRLVIFQWKNTRKHVSSVANQQATYFRANYTSNATAILIAELQHVVYVFWNAYLPGLHSTEDEERQLRQIYPRYRADIHPRMFLLNPVQQKHSQRESASSRRSTHGKTSQYSQNPFKMEAIHLYRSNRAQKWSWPMTGVGGSRATNWSGIFGHAKTKQIQKRRKTYKIKRKKWKHVKNSQGNKRNAWVNSKRADIWSYQWQYHSQHKPSLFFSTWSVSGTTASKPVTY